MFDRGKLGKGRRSFRFSVRKHIHIPLDKLEIKISEIETDPNSWLHFVNKHTSVQNNYKIGISTLIYLFLIIFGGFQWSRMFNMP